MNDMIFPNFVAVNFVGEDVEKATKVNWIDYMEVSNRLNDIVSDSLNTDRSESSEVKTSRYIEAYNLALLLIDGNYDRGLSDVSTALLASGFQKFSVGNTYGLTYSHSDTDFEGMLVLAGRKGIAYPKEDGFNVGRWGELGVIEQAINEREEILFNMDKTLKSDITFVGPNELTDIVQLYVRLPEYDACMFAYVD